MNDTYLHHYEEPGQSRSAGLSHRYIDLSVVAPGLGNTDVDANNWNTSFDWAAGGLVSTPSDIHRFYLGLFSGALLDDVSVIASVDNRVTSDDEPPVHGLGFSLRLSEDGNAVVSYEHGGAWGSYMMHAPATRKTFSFTANQTVFSRFDEVLVEALKLFDGR